MDQDGDSSSNSQEQGTGIKSSFLHIIIMLAGEKICSLMLELQ